MSKRPTYDLKSLTALTSDEAVAMPEATQRTAAIEKPKRVVAEKAKPNVRLKTEDLVSLSFKVPPEFHRSFCMSAAKAGLKLNELLFASTSLWQEKNDKSLTSSKRVSPLDRSHAY